ncbi:MAG: magnesium transporter, partial [Candidatus Methanomethylophilaceae archaeon]|nr:magnesium transporter [Candidatus Methanomethylophilaceae archaeon]
MREIGAVRFIGENKEAFSMGLAATVVSSLVALTAGLFLSSLTDYLTLLPGLMIVLYAAIGMRGTIFGAMGSRLGTSMHIGTFELSFRKGSVLRANFESSIVLSLFMSLAMGLAARGLLLAMGSDSITLSQFVFISIVGGMMASFMLLLLNVLMAREGFKREWDIDNISSPLMAAAGDLITLPMIFLAAWMVLHSPLWVIDGAFFVLTLIAVVLFLRVLLRKSDKRTYDEAKRIVKHSSPILLICLIPGLMAGLVIDSQVETLITSAALLILLPAFLNEGNALSGILTSRLSSMIHMGTLQPDRFPSRMAGANFLIVYMLSIPVFMMLGLAAHWLAIISGASSPGLPLMLGISLIAGLITASILNVLC